MQIGRYQVSTLRPAPVHSISFLQDGRVFVVATDGGYEVWRTWPLALIRRKALPGTLALALPLPSSPLLVLQGGGTTPLYSPNKAVIYHDKLGVAIAELEFGERIRGVVARQNTLCIALSHRVIEYEYGIGSQPNGGKGKSEDVVASAGFWMRKAGEWGTTENENGLMAIATAPGSALLALPGRQPGHVQLVQLSPSPDPTQSTPPSIARPTAFRSPIILAHTHPLSTLACTPSGSHIVTTSERGTLLRVWDTARGQLDRELRRGVDRAEMWGVGFEGALSEPSKGGRVVGWSDKGTVHVWGSREDVQQEGGSRSSTPTSQTPSITHLLSRNLPLPKYFSSTASSVQYHLPRKNPHAFSSVVGAAAGKAGVPSAKLGSGEDDGEREWAERFVVRWIDVEVDDTKGGETESHPGERKVKQSSTDFGTQVTGSIVSGAHLGSREERRSFGSDANSSRTATPIHSARLGGTRVEATNVPPRPRRQSSGLSTTSTSTQIRSSSSNKVPIPQSRHVRTTLPRGDSSEPKGTRIVMEKQLVAITYSGDWYRLRIPDYHGGDTDEERETRRKGKCELVEYRRLGVGGGGW